jgi:hypothetical protein
MNLKRDFQTSKRNKKEKHYIRNPKIKISLTGSLIVIVVKLIEMRDLGLCR